MGTRGLIVSLTKAKISQTIWVVFLRIMTARVRFNDLLSLQIDIKINTNFREI